MLIKRFWWQYKPFACYWRLYYWEILHVQEIKSSKKVQISLQLVMAWRAKLIYPKLGTNFIQILKMWY